MARVGGRVLRGMAGVSTLQDRKWEEGREMLVNLSLESLQEPFREAAFRQLYPQGHPAAPPTGSGHTAAQQGRTLLETSRRTITELSLLSATPATSRGGGGDSPT